jgi:hypothetical protein
MSASPLMPGNRRGEGQCIGACEGQTRGALAAFIPRKGRCEPREWCRKAVPPLLAPLTPRKEAGRKATN